MTADLYAVWRFVHQHTGVALSSDMKAIGQVRDGEVVAGVLYENWNSENVWMHIAIAPGVIVSPRWARSAFDYPFDDIGVGRITAEVAEHNKRCRRLIERIGFRVEAQLEGAAQYGGRLLLYRLVREDCTLLRPRRRPDASILECAELENSHG
jgi:RimJ/RimL family protein N-acetyltransferase